MRRFCQKNVIAVILLGSLCLLLYYAVIGSLTSHMTHLQEALGIVSNKIGIPDYLQKHAFLTLNMRNIYFPVADKNITSRNVLPPKFKTQNHALNISAHKNSTMSKEENVENDPTLQNNVTNGVGNISPHKVFIYELPEKFSGGLIECVSQKYGANCYDTSDFGYGRQLYTDHGLSVRATWQFSLELIIHNKLLRSPHRTRNASEASMFYVPYYGALASFCYQLQINFTYPINFTEYAGELSIFLMQQTQFQDGRPHVMTLGRIEREMRAVGYPIMPRSHLHHVVFVGIEQEINDRFRRFYTSRLAPLIVAPYPSYGHLLGKSGTIPTYLETLYREPRNVFILLAASTRRSSPLRGILLDQFAKSATRVSYTDYFSTRYNGSMTDTIWLQTEECNNQHENETMSWMKRSVFCLQPSGDSPTRKSFYDAVLAGCIPVIFRGDYNVIYPFETKLNYASFTVSINETEVVHKHVTRILAPFKTVHREKVKTMQQGILNVLPWLQYNYPPDNNSGPDALDLILQEIVHRFNI